VNSICSSQTSASVGLNAKPSVCNAAETATLTLTQADRRKLEAFEMWIWGRMEKNSSADKKTNE